MGAVVTSWTGFLLGPGGSAGAPRGLHGGSDPQRNPTSAPRGPAGARHPEVLPSLLPKDPPQKGLRRLHLAPWGARWPLRVSPAVPAASPHVGAGTVSQRTRPHAALQLTRLPLDATGVPVPPERGPGVSLHPCPLGGSQPGVLMAQRLSALRWRGRFPACSSTALPFGAGAPRSLSPRVWPPAAPWAQPGSEHPQTACRALWVHPVPELVPGGCCSLVCLPPQTATPPGTGRCLVSEFPRRLTGEPRTQYVLSKPRVRGRRNENCKVSLGTQQVSRCSYTRTAEACSGQTAAEGEFP